MQQIFNEEEAGVSKCDQELCKPVIHPRYKPWLRLESMQDQEPSLQSHAESVLQPDIAGRHVLQNEELQQLYSRPVITEVQALIAQLLIHETEVRTTEGDPCATTYASLPHEGHAGES